MMRLWLSKNSAASLREQLGTFPLPAHLLGKALAAVHQEIDDVVAHRVIERVLVDIGP